MQPVPPRTPPEESSLDPIHRAWLETLGNLLLILPGCLALAWLLVRWLTWKTVLERRRGDPNDPLVNISLAARTGDLLDALDLSQTLERLHTPVAVPTRRLDIDATVDRTARHAGLLQPVHRTRRGVPALVVLVEQRHASDQMAGLAGEFVDRLHEAGLDLYRYDYRDSPQRLIGYNGRWHSLTKVAGRHAGARLLLIGEPAALIDPFSGTALPWLDAFAPWPERGLLVTRRPPARWQPALTEAGFVVAEFDSAGIRALALHRSGHLNDRPTGADLVLPNLTIPLPRLLQDAWRWTQPVAPAEAEQTRLLSVLDDYLRPDGIRLLTAMAAYPQIHWGLTRLLDLSLFPCPNTVARERRRLEAIRRPWSSASWLPDRLHAALPERLSRGDERTLRRLSHRLPPPGFDAVARERRLLKVVRLPWSRAGWLPNWLRAALLKRLDRAGEHMLRQLYRQLLHPEPETTAGRLRLPVALLRAIGLWAGLRDWLRHRGWWLDRWLSASRTLSAPHGALNDAVFARILFGWRRRLLDFVLPRHLLRRHIGGTLRRALLAHAVLAVALAATGAWLAEIAWNQWGRETAESRLLTMQNTAQAQELPGQTFRDHLQIGGTGPEMVSLPGGSFLMGSPDGEPKRDGDEGPQHWVTVRSFVISRTEVRFADYDRFAETTGRERPDDSGWGRGDRPVINVSWHDARAYAKWLSEQTGQSYRLPTEAE